MYGHNFSAGFGELKDYQEFWLTAEQQLDDDCKLYGKGKNATGARNIRIEDVDKITGFDKTTYEKGNVSEYGNKITWYYTGTNTLQYATTNSKSVEIKCKNGFHYYDGEGFVEADLSKTSGIITTAINTSYFYNVQNCDAEIKKSKAYEMLFGESGKENKAYLLASTWHSAGSYGIFGVYDEFVGEMSAVFGAGDNFIWDVYGNYEFVSGNSRAVVSLSGDVNPIPSETGWTY